MWNQWPGAVAAVPPPTGAPPPQPTAAPPLPDAPPPPGDPGKPLIGPVLPGAGVTPAPAALAATAAAYSAAGYGQYTAAQIAAMTPEQQYALQQHWQQWQAYQQEYAKWHAQYGEQYNREMAAAAAAGTTSAAVPTAPYATAYYQQPPPPPPPDNTAKAAASKISGQPQIYTQPPPPLPQSQAPPPPAGYPPVGVNTQQPPPPTAHWPQAAPLAGYHQPPPKMQQPPPAPSYGSMPPYPGQQTAYPPPAVQPPYQAGNFGGPANPWSAPPPSMQAAQPPPPNAGQKPWENRPMDQVPNKFDKPPPGTPNQWQSPGGANPWRASSSGPAQRDQRDAPKQPWTQDQPQQQQQRQPNRQQNADNRWTGGNSESDSNQEPWPKRSGKDHNEEDTSRDSWDRNRGNWSDQRNNSWSENRGDRQQRGANPWSNNNNNNSNNNNNNFNRQNPNNRNDRWSGGGAGAGGDNQTNMRGQRDDSRWGNRNNANFGGNDDSNDSRWSSSDRGGSNTANRFGGGPNGANRQGGPQQQQQQQQQQQKKAAELDEASFDQQFRQWEQQFEDWKRANANHPDREMYNMYEQEFERQRLRIMERRDQMRRKRQQQQQQQQQQQPFKSDETQSQEQGDSRQQPLPGAQLESFVNCSDDETARGESDQRPQRLPPNQRGNVAKEAIFDGPARKRTDSGPSKQPPKRKLSGHREDSDSKVINLDDDESDEEKSRSQNADGEDEKKISGFFNKSDGIPGLDLVEEGAGGETETSASSKNGDDGPTRPPKVQVTSVTNLPSLLNMQIDKPTESKQQPAANPLNPDVANALKDPKLLQQISNALARAQGRAPVSDDNSNSNQVSENNEESQNDDADDKPLSFAEWQRRRSGRGNSAKRNASAERTNPQGPAAGDGGPMPFGGPAGANASNFGGQGEQNFDDPNGPNRIGPNFRGPNFNCGPNFGGGGPQFNDGPNRQNGPNFRGQNMQNFGPNGPNFQGPNGPNFQGPNGPNFQGPNGPPFGPNGPMGDFRGNFGPNSHNRGNMNFRGNNGPPPFGGNKFGGNFNPQHRGPNFGGGSNFNGNDQGNNAAGNDNPGIGGGGRSSNPFRRSGGPVFENEPFGGGPMGGNNNINANRSSWIKGSAAKNTPTTNDTDYFRPVQIIDYQNAPLKPKVIDYGHKAPAEGSFVVAGSGGVAGAGGVATNAVQDTLYQPVKTIDYGHSPSAVKNLTPAKVGESNDPPGIGSSGPAGGPLGGPPLANRTKGGNRKSAKRRNLILQKFGGQPTKQKPGPNAPMQQQQQLEQPPAPTPTPPPPPPGSSLLQQQQKSNLTPQNQPKETTSVPCVEDLADALEDISDTEEDAEESSTLLDAPAPPSLTEDEPAIPKSLFPSVAAANQPVPVSEPPKIDIDEILFKPGRLTRPRKMCIIMRGPPGSGKTYAAKLIKEKENEMGGESVRILSIDDYFMIENDYEEKCPKSGKKIPKKEILYEYDKDMEETYMQYLSKQFKKTIADNLYDIIIVDCNNNKLRTLNEFYCHAAESGFTPFIVDLLCPLEQCMARNAHGRLPEDVGAIIDSWEATPANYRTLDISTLLDNVIEMEDAEDMATDNVDDTESCNANVEDKFTTAPNDDSQDQAVGDDDNSNDEPTPCGFLKSKWESDNTTENLARLDGTNKLMAKRKATTMEDYLQMDDWEPPKADANGKKRVRWADIEEKNKQEKMRAIGFVVGQTDWNRMMDPNAGNRALNKTKFIERVNNKRRL